VTDSRDCNNTQRPLSGSEPNRHVVWTAGLLTCVLVPRANSPRYVVQVLDRDRIVVSEPCRDAEQAVRIADTLWSMLVNRQR